ncbi:MAG: hypothetical protein WA869_32635, partial [Alloacidobacterium sp.]
RKSDQKCIQRADRRVAGHFCATLICPGWLHWIAGIVFQQVPRVANSYFSVTDGLQTSLHGRLLRSSHIFWIE